MEKLSQSRENTSIVISDPFLTPFDPFVSLSSSSPFTADLGFTVPAILPAASGCPGGRRCSWSRRWLCADSGISTGGIPRARRETRGSLLCCDEGPERRSKTDHHQSPGSPRV